METSFKYVINYTLENKYQEPVEFDSNINYSDHEHDETLHDWVKDFILKTVNTDKYKEGDVVFAKRIVVSEWDGKEYKPIYSPDKVLQVYPPID